MRHRLLLAVWIAGDLLIFVGSYSLAYFLRVGWIFSTDFPLARFLAITVTVAPFFLLMLLSLRTFAMTRNQASLATGGAITFAALAGIALFTLGYYFRFTQFFSRILLIMAFLLSGTMTWAWHILWGRTARIVLHTTRAPTFPTLIIGATREAARLIHTLRRRKSPLVPVALLDAKGTKERTIEGIPIYGKLNRLEEVLREKRITHLIQCSDLEQSTNLLSACRARGITYMLLPSVLGIVEHDERIESLEGHQVTVVRPPQPWWSWFFQ